MPLTVNPDERLHQRGGTTADIDQSPVFRYAVLRHASLAGACPPNTLYERYGPAGHGQAVGVECNRKEPSAKRVNEMPRRKVTGVAPTLNEHGSLASGDRLRNDFGCVPISYPRPSTEQHCVSIGQKPRPIINPAIFC